jgi:hypothetical protein
MAHRRRRRRRGQFSDVTPAQPGTNTDSSESTSNASVSNDAQNDVEDNTDS